MNAVIEQPQVVTQADARRETLRRLAAANGGVLLPEQVVEAARPIESPLHSAFEWDDSAAAEAYRLTQARQLIRVTVQTMKVKGEDRDVRVFVSLTPDREEGGYREVASVMVNSEQRAQLLADALAEMQRFETKYSALQELAEVFQAMKRVRK